MAESIDWKKLECITRENIAMCQLILDAVAANRSEIKLTPQSSPAPLSGHHILKVVAKYYGLSRGKIVSRTKVERICWPRMVAAYFIHTEARWPLVKVGLFLGRRHHGTVLNAVKVVKDRMDVDPDVVREIAEIRTVLARP